MRGKLDRIEAFSSAFVQSRNIDIWLPGGYAQSSEAYPVVYLHDGQNLFLDHLSYSGVAWDIHLTMEDLLYAGTIRPAILVGIWNTVDRIPEYMAQDAFDPFWAWPKRARFARQFGSAAKGNTYLSFIVDELKPHIDATYRTLPGPAHTMMMGSSMGGLSTLYAFCQYPDVFHRVAALSPSWSVPGQPFIHFLRRRLPDPKGRVLYLDAGDEVKSPVYQGLLRKAERHMEHAGYEPPLFSSMIYPGASHSEASWRARLHEPLTLLLGTPRVNASGAETDVETDRTDRTDRAAPRKAASHDATSTSIPPEPE